jgi:hypothetical protein
MGPAGKRSFRAFLSGVCEGMLVHLSAPLIRRCSRRRWQVLLIQRGQEPNKGRPSHPPPPTLHLPPSTSHPPPLTLHLPSSTSHPPPSHASLLRYFLVIYSSTVPTPSKTSFVARLVESARRFLWEGGEGGCRGGEGVGRGDWQMVGRMRGGANARVGTPPHLLSHLLHAAHLPRRHISSAGRVNYGETLQRAVEREV